MNRPRILKGETPYIQTPEGKLYVTLNENTDHKLIEIIPTIGKTGDIQMELAKAIGILATLLLQGGTSPEHIAKQLRFIQSGKAIWDEGQLVLSISDGIAIIIQEYLRQNKDDSSGNPPPEV